MLECPKIHCSETSWGSSVDESEVAAEDPGVCELFSYDVEYKSHDLSTAASDMNPSKQDPTVESWAVVGDERDGSRRDAPAHTN